MMMCAHCKSFAERAQASPARNRERLIARPLRVLLFLFVLIMGSPAWCFGGSATPGVPVAEGAVDKHEQAGLLFNIVGLSAILISIAVGVKTLKGDKEAAKANQAAERTHLMAEIEASVLAALAKQSRSQEQHTHIANQPLGIELHQDFVPKPDFDGHKREIWDELNGLKKAVATIATDVARIAAHREENGHRLEVLTHDLKAIATKIDTLAGELSYITGRKKA